MIKKIDMDINTKQGAMRYLVLLIILAIMLVILVVAYVNRTYMGVEDAVVVSVSEIESERTTVKFFRTRYYRNVTYMISNPNSVNFTGFGVYSSNFKGNVEAIKPGTKIKVKNDGTIADNIGDKTFEIVLYIAMAVGMIFEIKRTLKHLNKSKLKNETSILEGVEYNNRETDHLIYKEIENKRNDVILKVTKVQVIDYEMEKVFFTDDSSNVYVYETDLGEEFKENCKYKVNLTFENKKRTKIDYEGNRIKAIKIVLKDKSEFREENNGE